MQLRRLLSVAALVLAFSHPAHAGEGVFGWIYTLDLQPKGKMEFEQKAFLQAGQSQGEYQYWQFKSELEYGVSENYQVAGYINHSYTNAYRNDVNGETGGPGTNFPADFDTSTRYRRFRFDSVAVENLWRLTNPLTDPIGVGVYIEPEVGPYSRELETRLILQKNFLDDRLIVAGNLMLATEHERSSGEIERASMIDTTLGFSYRFANRLSAGLEYRNHREYVGYRFNQREHSAHFLGPNFHYATKDWWMTVAWRHQMPWVKAYSEDQQGVVVNHRIYGDEHARNEFMIKVGVPF